MRTSVCLAVCLSVCEHISKTAGPIFTNFFVHVPKGRGSELLRRCDDALCTSSFRDYFVTARCYASAVLAVVVCLCVCLSVCHKPVLYQNSYR